MINTGHDLVEVLRARGRTGIDGEAVTHLQHAWQCGRIALAQGADPEMCLAAWLHDIGHLLTDLSATPALARIDRTGDEHEVVGARVLRRLFGDAVADTVALHVHAKRYLVAARDGYTCTLSPDSRRSLRLQGGPMAALEALRFLERPAALRAIRLRVWDDDAKHPLWQPDSDEAALDELASLIETVIAGERSPRQSELPAAVS
jgi:predicted HD phosphohydrolase